MQLAEFIAQHRTTIIARWKEQVVKRLAIRLEESELVNNLPGYLDNLIDALRGRQNHQAALEDAAEHGRHRADTDVDVGKLIQEMALVAEVIVELIQEADQVLDSAHARVLINLMARAMAASGRAYANRRDQQLSDQMARQFSFLAHEIRNPLNNARLAAEGLKIAGESGRADFLKLLDNALNELSEQVDNSLVEARLYGEPELNREILNSTELVDRVWSEVAAHAQKRGLVLDRDVEPFEFEGDSRLVISALTNLLSNGVKFTKPGGKVLIRARVENEEAVFWVDDECGGLPPGLPDTFFQPFVQLGRDRSGFGLGLSIVKQVADAHCGSVRVVDRPGKGCSFVLRLPRGQG